ncbi:MAG: protein kinase domain-containing protein [Chthoniobacterales bacterium]
MTPARLQTIEEIFHSALAQEPNQVGSFLDKTCQGDAALRSKVEMLVASHSRAGVFMEIPAVDLATKILYAQPDSLVGQRISHYELSEKIGAGGMGEVYLASDLTARRKAALKLLPPRFTGDAERLKRFEQEARAVAGLNHPNILTIYEIGEDSSTHFIASELIDGETLRQRLERDTMEVEEALEVAIQVATALSAAHDAGIVHRDIKPENIMLRPDGYVKVLDFGIAKLAEQELPGTILQEDAVLLVETHFGSILGTARYMSPEQTGGGAVDQRTDIWSLGVVLYEMIAGHAPFGGDTSKEVMTSILATEPPPLSDSQTPVELQEIIKKTLRKGPADRYQNASELRKALKDCRHGIDLGAGSKGLGVIPSGMRRLRMPVALALVGLISVVTLLVLHWRRTEIPVAQKSIAVLPFANLTKDQDDSYFAVGIQDEILTDLARIADLKVVSRTSTSSYLPGQPGNSRRIGEELGVAHLLEGSVQRIAHRVRINAQLIDTRTDSHLWAQTYDRDVADVFAIQSEIAKAIAEQLQSRISQREKAAIAEPPTTDLIAHKLYLQALLLESPYDDDSMRKGIRLLEQAVARDPRFLRAYCALARFHLWLYDGAEHNAGRVQAAIAAIDKAAQIQPDAGEVHLVRAHYLSRALRDYDRARAELELARRALPNDPALYFEAAIMDRRQGRFAEGLGNFERAIELDPRNLAFLDNAAGTYAAMRRYAKATELYRRALAVTPQANDFRLYLANTSTSEWADIRPLRAELNALAAKDPGAVSRFAVQFWYCAILERDATAADRALAAMPPEGGSHYLGSVRPKEWYLGRTARLFNRPDVARQAFAAASAIFEKHLREVPDDGLSWSILGRARAGLGEKEQAIAAGRHACDVWPISKEPTWGFEVLLHLAKIYAAVGEKDLAIQQLSACAKQPCDTDYGDLKLNPDWDPLRGDPRFEKLVASLAPKEK